MSVLAEPRVLLPTHISGEPPPWGHVVHKLHGQTMGTTWSVRLVAPPGLRLAPVQALVQQGCDEVVRQMSHWCSDSVLSRFNRLSPGQSLQLPAAFAQVMDAALHIAEVSGGAYDPAAGELVALWGFGPEGSRHQDAGFAPPTPERCAALPLAPWRELVWEPASARLTQGGRARLDLSSIAKGYAVDAVSEALLDCGLPHHLVEIGGELRGHGFKPGAQPWWVALEPPHPQLRTVPTRLALHGLAVATSGDYRRCYLDAHGQHQSHTLDPRQRQPVRHALTSVSVLHPQALWADGWSTALMVLGPEQGADLARRLGLAALFVSRTEGAPEAPLQEWLSPALQALVA
ncbi:FAD:protein FMN transferase [Roseateles sp. BYS180W]|uniref:FAD:protein FMN transferase n=1 Tax=Roseateles rivi TaxID=3299028 RepID=A0ABW7FT72_9BURK